MRHIICMTLLLLLFMLIEPQDISQDILNVGALTLDMPNLSVPSLSFMDAFVILIHVLCLLAMIVYLCDVVFFGKRVMSVCSDMFFCVSLLVFFMLFEYAKGFGSYADGNNLLEAVFVGTLSHPHWLQKIELSLCLIVLLSHNQVLQKAVSADNAGLAAGVIFLGFMVYEIVSFFQNQISDLWVSSMLVPSVLADIGRDHLWFLGALFPIGMFLQRFRHVFEGDAPETVVVLANDNSSPHVDERRVAMFIGQ